MMKKMITLAAAALVLSACGSDAPAVEDASTPSTDANYQVTLTALQSAWNSQDAETQHVMCGHWTRTPADVIELFMDERGETSTEAVMTHFNKVCG